MKKIFIIALVISLFAAPAFAATSVGAGAALTAGSETLTTLSNNVTASVLSSAERFAATTFHINGSKEFATASTSTKIFSHNTSSLTTVTASDTSQFTGWTTL